MANRLLKRVRDFAQVAAKEQIDLEIVKFALEMLHVDERGLDETDHKVLRTMIELYGGGPVGLNTLAANIGEDTETIADMIEPYLLQIGFIKRTARGRVRPLWRMSIYAYHIPKIKEDDFFDRRTFNDRRF